MIKLKFRVYCKDCNKLLGDNARYNKSKRCKKCSTKYIWKNLKYNTKQTQTNLKRTYRDYLYTIKILKKLGQNYIISFSGFWEGEGSLCQCYNTKSKNLSYIFSISQKDNYIFKLRNYFKFGKINNYNKNDCLQWLFGGVGHIYGFIEAMNPYIKLNKRHIQIDKFLKDKYVKRFRRYMKRI